MENDEGDPVLRFHFDIIAGENGPVRYSAALEYLDDKKWHAKLNEDLSAFFPQGEIDQMLGMPQEVDLTDLVGNEVDLMISTFTGSHHPPYSRVTGIFSAGGFVTGTYMTSDSCAASSRALKATKSTSCWLPLHGTSASGCGMPPHFGSISCA
jgi:hypothetical protein